MALLRSVWKAGTSRVMACVYQLLVCSHKHFLACGPNFEIDGLLLARSGKSKVLYAEYLYSSVLGARNLSISMLLL